jgi:hypothetical protein
MGMDDSDFLGCPKAKTLSGRALSGAAVQRAQYDPDQCAEGSLSPHQPGEFSRRNFDAVVFGWRVHDVVVAFMAEGLPARSSSKG